MKRMEFPKSLMTEFELIEVSDSISLISCFHVRAKSSDRQHYSLRLLHSQLWADKSVISSFHDFFSSFSQVSNRAYIPQVRSVVGSLNNPVYVLEEFVTGTALGNYLRRKKLTTPTSDDLSAIIYRVCEALHHCHQKDVFHLCVTPGDILIQDNNLNRIKLCNFGTQVFVRSGKMSLFPGEMRKYLAPEVIQSNEYGPQADIYSLGVTLSQTFHDVASWRDPLEKSQSARPSDRFQRIRDMAGAIQESAKAPVIEKREDDLCPLESRGGLLPVGTPKLETHEEKARPSKPTRQRAQHESSPQQPGQDISAPEQKASFSWKTLSITATILMMLTAGIALYFYQSREKEIAELKQTHVKQTEQNRRIAQQQEAERLKKLREDQEDRERREKEIQEKLDRESQERARLEEEARKERVKRDSALPSFALNYPEETKNILYRAINGSSDDQTEIALRYASGSGGVPKDESEAIRWFYEAAEKGHVRAQYRLARIYYDGIGISIDCAKAIKWFEKAAQNGNMRAICTLGNMYEDGICIERDYHTARKWYGTGRGNSPHGVGLWNQGVHYENSGNRIDAMDCFRRSCERDMEGWPD